MKKTLITLIALSGITIADDYTYIGGQDGWAEEAKNWKNADGALLKDSGLLSSDNSLTPGNNFIIADGQSVKAGGNTGGFAGATVVIQNGGTLKIDETSAVGSSANVTVQGTLSIANNKILGPAQVSVDKGGKIEANGYIGAATITLNAGAVLTTDGDLKLNGTTFNVSESLNLGNTWLDGNDSCGSATFNLGDSGIVNYDTVVYHDTRWKGSITLSANCLEGALTGSGDVLLYERTLVTATAWNAANYDNGGGRLEDLFANHVNGGTITLNGTTLTFASEGFDAGALTAAHVGQYQLVMENNAIKVQYAAYAPIPEPTTATLSLLALAGLAARRRRNK